MSVYFEIRLPRRETNDASGFVLVSKYIYLIDRYRKWIRFFKITVSCHVSKHILTTSL